MGLNMPLPFFMLTKAWHEISPSAAVCYCARVIQSLSLVFSVDALTLVFLIKEYDLNYSFNLIFIS